MTTLFRADLHCHSTCSDGSLTPTELLWLAKQSNLQALSITDHDTTEAYQTAFTAAKAAQILLISGAEFSTVHQGHTVHLLAYAYPLHNRSIDELCHRHRQRRSDRNSAILDQLTRRGMPLTLADVEAEAAPGTMLGRPHIALAMKRKNYISNIREAFQRYLSDGAPCYVQGDAVTTEETIALLHQAKAYVVLAHPHLIEGAGLVQELLQLPFDGIEAYYGTFTLEHHKRWLQLAERHGLFITGGSDFHGTIRPQVALGCSWTQEPTFRLLQKRFLSNQGQQEV